MTVTGSNRVLRGGSWNNNARNCRSANRNNDRPDNRNSNVGFRLVSTRFCEIAVVYGSQFGALGFVQVIARCWRRQTNIIDRSG